VPCTTSGCVSPRGSRWFNRDKLNFFRQFYATFFNDPPARWLFGTWGSHNLMWSNDYPHPHSTWPKSWDVIARDLGHVSEETRAWLLRDNVRELYKLPALTPVAG